MAKPDGPVFDREWRNRTIVTPVAKSNADALAMIRKHYLGKWPGVTTLILMMREGVRPIGLIVFALPPRETSVRYGANTWELARLWISDEVPTNGESYLISQAVRWIKRNRPDVECLVSYADPSAGHAGVIYRAANWQADGKTDDGRKSPRCDYACKVTGKKFSRRAHIPEGVDFERIPRVRKSRFVYRLGKAA